MRRCKLLINGKLVSGTATLLSSTLRPKMC